jgi:hypothetical protein
MAPIGSSKVERDLSAVLMVRSETQLFYGNTTTQTFPQSNPANQPPWTRTQPIFAQREGKFNDRLNPLGRAKFTGV